MSSPVVAVCPHCEKKLKIRKPELIGKKVKCPGCSQPFRLEPYEETYSFSQTEEAPAASSNDDDWLSALGEAAQSEQSTPPSTASSSLPPRADKPKKKKTTKTREFGPEPIPGSDDDDRYGYGVEEGMSRGLIGAIIGGVVAGAVGALIWGGITYGTGYEVAYVAWGIGALVGFGVLLGAQEYAGVTTGIIALVLANLSIFFGKVFAVWMLLAGLANEFQVDVQTDFVANESYLISEMADEIVEKRMAAGEQLKFPRENPNFDYSVDYPADIWKEATQRWNAMSPNEQTELRRDTADFEPNPTESFLISMVAEDILMEREDAGLEIAMNEYDYSVDYPPEIWEEAETQWNALSPDQQQARKEDAESEFEDFNLLDAADLSVIEITWETLGPFDGLWILLASFTAYRIGANEHEED